MEQVAAIVIVLLVVVFAVAAGSKLRSREDFAAFVASVPAFGVRRSWARPVAFGTVVVEASVVALLLCSPLVGTAGAGLWLSVGLLLALTIGVVRSIRRGAGARCRCFGRAEVRLSARHGWRNGTLLLLATVAALIDPDLGTLPADQWVMAVAGGVLLAAGYLRLDDLTALFSTSKAQ
jgi:hypothetical protein